MKIIIAIFMIFFFFYGIFSLFKGVNSAGQTSLTAEKTNLSSEETKNITSLTPKKNEVKKGQSIATSTINTNTTLSETKVVKKITEEITEAPKAQIIKAVITYDDGLVPSTFNVKVNVPVRFEIDVKDDMEECMNTILISGLYDEPILVQAGEKIIMEFTSKKIGLYNITCAMGIPWGDINVQ